MVVDHIMPLVIQRPVLETEVVLTRMRQFAHALQCLIDRQRVDGDAEQLDLGRLARCLLEEGAWHDGEPLAEQVGDLACANSGL